VARKIRADDASKELASIYDVQHIHWLMWRTVNHGVSEVNNLIAITVHLTKATVFLFLEKRFSMDPHSDLKMNTSRHLQRKRAMKQLVSFRRAVESAVDVKTRRGLFRRRL
jgi:hypothetical protein